MGWSARGPAWQLDMLADVLYVRRLQLKNNPAWFRSLVWNEVLLQFPFFFFGTRALNEALRSLLQHHHAQRGM